MNPNDYKIPAFPQFAVLDGDDGLITGDCFDYGSGGMTLRDYFAAKYLMGYMANPNCSFPTREDAAEEAYLMADAMLKERSK